MAKKHDPNEVVHLQVAEGENVVYGDISYGPRAALQVQRGALDRVDGKYHEVDPHAVPDVADRK